jgi:hypothetical protein
MDICNDCGAQYSRAARVGRPGKVTVCEDCAEEVVEAYSGNMIYCHKTGCSVQINKSRKLTDYISRATSLRNKGSNLGNNLKVSGPVKSSGLCARVVGADSNAKGRTEQ